MRLAPKYIIYQVYDRYKAPRRIYVDLAHSKKDAQDLASLISSKGTDSDGRIDFYGEIEWSGFSII